jgi:flagellar motor switch protein FliM
LEKRQAHFYLSGRDGRCKRLPLAQFTKLRCLRLSTAEGDCPNAFENCRLKWPTSCAFTNLRDAWAHVADLTIEKVGSEMNPHFANIVRPTEIVVVTRFSVELDGCGGDFHVTMPYSMIEPLREVLDSGMQSDRVEQDDRWSQTLKHEVGDAPVEVRALLGHTMMTLADLMNMKVGDVLSTDFTGTLTLLAEDIPMFRGTYGMSRGQQAVKVGNLIRRTRPGATEAKREQIVEAAR